MEKTVCPDCGQIIEKEEQPCPNCGCPSVYFTAVVDTISKKYVTVCPDCGKTWEGLFPAQCDNCGCPSNDFIKHEIVKATNDTFLSSNVSKTSSRNGSVFFLILVLIMISGGVCYAIWNHNKKKEEITYALRKKPWNLYNLNSDNYSIDELRAMLGGERGVASRHGLKGKMLRNGDILQGWDEYRSLNKEQSEVTKIKMDNGHESTKFRHERDVHKYLRNHDFSDANGKITISESYNLALKFNGRELTGAIVITEFNSYAAYFTAHSPISGLTYQFIVNCEQGVLYCVSDGTTYYAR